MADGCNLYCTERDFNQLKEDLDNFIENLKETHGNPHVTEEQVNQEIHSLGEKEIENYNKVEQQLQKDLNEKITGSNGFCVS